MSRRLQKTAFVLALLLLALATLPALASGTKATLTASVKVYQKASTSAEAVKVSKGTEVKVEAVKGKWAKVSRAGKTGYVQVKYLETETRTAMYVNKDTYVYKSASTSSSHRSVSMNTKVYVVGKSGSYYKVQNASGSATGYLKASCVSKSKVSAKKSSKAWKSKVVKMDWFGAGQNVLKKGAYGYIYDIDTGIELRIKRMGGHNHADVEPATAADTAKLLRVANGMFSWQTHAVILKAGGKYVACGINTKPHGDQTIHNNNYDGQFCLHMSGSWTHCSKKENAEHQRSINRAYNWAHR